MTDAYEAPRKIGYFLVAFIVDDGALTTYRFTDATDDVVVDGDTYSSVPAMEIDFPEASGQFDQKPVKITVPSGAHAFFARAANGEPMPPMTATIKEVVEVVANDPVVTPASNTLYLYKGTVTKTTYSAARRKEVVKFEVVALKGQMIARLGISATPECPWIFRQLPCGAEAAAAAEEQTGLQVDTIVGNLVTLLAVGPRGIANDIFQGGVMRNEEDGVEIGIRVWADASPTNFYLYEPPPASWATSVDITIKPACHRSLAACQDWGQEDVFGGVGKAIPNVHKVHEVE